MSHDKKAKEKLYKHYEPPRIAPWFRHDRTPRWLILEPAPLAMVGGVLCGILALVVCLLRQWWGAVMAPASVLVGVTLTFVVGYTLVGLFAWYVLRIADKEFPRNEAENLAGHKVPTHRGGAKTPGSPSGDQE